MFEIKNQNLTDYSYCINVMFKAFNFIIPFFARLWRMVEYQHPVRLFETQEGSKKGAGNFQEAPSFLYLMPFSTMRISE